MKKKPIAILLAILVMFLLVVSTFFGVRKYNIWSINNEYQKVNILASVTLTKKVWNEGDISGSAHQGWEYTYKIDKDKILTEPAMRKSFYDAGYAIDIENGSEFLASSDKIRALVAVSSEQVVVTASRR